MRLNKEQYTKLQAVFISAGLSLEAFDERWTDDEYYISYIMEPSIRFTIRRSIQGKSFGDVFCNPFTYQETKYMGCETFDDCLKLARDWAVVSKYKLLKRPYYHKVFISHCSKDKPIIDEFVDKVLRLSCGFKTSEIIYTSREDTGVGLGDGIPQFIKENLLSSSLVLFMISDNYKQSEVCLNEMGAAWALEKKIVSVVLPHCSFDSLGWLTSLEKAVKMNSSEGLDILYSMLVRTGQNVVDWNRQKEAFLKVCGEYEKQIEKVNREEKTPVSSSTEGSIRVFDEHLYFRCKTEGEFQYQVDLRIRAFENAILRKVYLKNHNEFIGDVSNARKVLSLVKFIPMGTLNLSDIRVDRAEELINKTFGELSKNVQDFFITKDSQQSISFIGGFETIRECDENMDLPMNHWSLCIEYNVNDLICIPLNANIIANGVNNYFWHN